MTFLDFSEPSFLAVAFKEDVTPPVCVVAGQYGTILYSINRQYADGFQVYEWEQAVSDTWQTINDLDYGNGRFMAACTAGLVLVSEDGQKWDVRETGSTKTLHGVVHITENIWIVVGSEGTILRTLDGGVTWTDYSGATSVDLYGIAYDGEGTIAACGFRDIVYSNNGGISWSVVNTGIFEDLYDIAWGFDSFVAVGAGSIIIEFIWDPDEGSSFEVKSSPITANYRAITYSGTGRENEVALFVIVGEDSVTVTSTQGDIWDSQDSGIPGANFYGIEYGDNRLVTVGAQGLVAYSATGAARPSFDLFQPISDVYRAHCHTQQDAYMLYANLNIFEEGEWNHYPRRILSPAPATIDDFNTVGWFFADLPGTGAILDCESIRGGIVLAETDQLGLLTDGGSLSQPWAYQQNYGEGLKPVSNLTSFNGVAYVIADDGLLYRATSTGVARLPGFFDLTRFEDWNADEESVWLGFDPIYQLLFVFRQQSPWKVWLVNDDTGGVSEIELPTITVEGVDYEPRSAFIVNGLHDGIHTSYAPITGGSDEILNVRLDLDGGITGIDDIALDETDRWYSEIASGSFRVVSLGMRGACDEILVRTWADPDSTVRPDVAVMVREETTDDWQTNDQPDGDITVFTDRVLGVGTAFSRYIDRGETNRVIDMNTPAVQITAVDMSVDWDGAQADINMNVPVVQIGAFDFLVQDGGQASINMSKPGLEITAVDMTVDHNPPIDMTVPSIQITAVDMTVHRGGYYKLPWLVDQCEVYTEDAAGNRSLASFTKTGDYELILDTPLNDYQSLYVNPGAVRPFVIGRAGDYIFTQYGAHRITQVDTAYQVQLNWYPPAQAAGTYVPAREMPAGGPEGDGKIIVGIGRPMDQFMFRVLLLPHEGCDATGAKITGIELGYRPSSQELKTDGG